MRRKVPIHCLAAVPLLLLVLSGRAEAQDELYHLEQAAIKAAVQHVAPSVVRVETLGGLEQVDGLLVGNHPTTGLIVSDDGYIVSSSFNFIQQPASILVTLPDGQRKPAVIIGRDHSRMLVLLKVNVPLDQPLPVPEAVAMDEMRIGQWTIALGRTYEQAAPNASVGILSALNRIWGKAIQTDAKISPSNYGGPLIDIYGRVLGVLVPLSPEAQEEVAGVQWYDSGIGFAVPLVHIHEQLDALKEGQELHPGLLGISMKGSDVHTGPAIVAATHPGSPAAKAGLQAGDKIIEAQGQPIERQAQLKHALAPLYAGQTVRLVALRSEQRVELDIELAAELPPYAHPFIGLLPLRTPENKLLVRYVFPGSPAEKAGFQRGDQILSAAGTAISSDQDLRQVLAPLVPGENLTIERLREDQKQKVQLDLAVLPTTIPDALPPARESAADPPGDRPATGMVEINIPEQQNKCLAYIPENYDPRLSYGIVLWLHEPGGYNAEQTISRWKEHCAAHDLILVAPQSADPSQWRPTEIEFVSKALEYVRKSYHIDADRIVAHGYQAGGAMALLVAMAQREVIRGAAAVDAPLPARARIPANEPMQRLAIYLAVADNSEFAARIAAIVEQLRELKYPVTVHQLGSQPRYLNEQELEQLVRWIDALDRI